eukprot:598970-Pelagomonas_calceolata.AAC.11
MDFRQGLRQGSQYQLSYYWLALQQSLASDVTEADWVLRSAKECFFLIPCMLSRREGLELLHELKGIPMRWRVLIGEALACSLLRYLS